MIYLGLPLTQCMLGLTPHKPGQVNTLKKMDGWKK